MKGEVDSEHPANPGPAVTRDVPDVKKGITNPDNINSVLLTNPKDVANDSNITKSDNIDHASHPDTTVTKEEEEGACSTEEGIGQEDVSPSPTRPDFSD